MFRGLFTAEQLFDGIFTVTHTMGWGGMVEARLAKASTRVGGYGLRVGSARLPYPSGQKSEIQQYAVVRSTRNFEKSAAISRDLDLPHLPMATPAPIRSIKRACANIPGTKAF